MDLDQGGQRQHLVPVVLHVVIAQPARVVPVGLFDLGDHLVAATFDGEPVDFAFAEQRRQGHAEIFHRDAHLRRFFTVDVDNDLRFVEGQIDIQEGELAGRLGLLLDAFGDLQQ